MAVSLRRIVQNRGYQEGYEKINWGREKNYIPEEQDYQEGDLSGAPNHRLW